jgi:CRP/FNR family transcriptional regulator, nitrogen oxide reductase regulator
VNRTSFAGNLISPFLSGLGQAELDDVLSAARRRDFPARTVVTEEGDPATNVFLLLSGRARFFFLTEEGRKVILHWIVPGEIVGGMGLLSEPMSYMVSSETVGRSSMLIWEHKAIRGLFLRYPKLLDNSLSVMSQYLILYRIGHAGLICNSARQRLATVMSDLARCIGQSTVKGVELDVTNEELASAANTTFFTVSRLLSEWQREGLVSKKRGRILVFSSAKLLSQTAKKIREDRESESVQERGKLEKAVESMGASIR